MWRKMFYGGKIGLGMVFFIMICQSVSADVVNIYPSEDSWIASGEQSTTPHGSVLLYPREVRFSRFV